jgi:hypothetical protein
MANPQLFGALGGPQISGAGGNPGFGNGNTFSYTAALTYIFTPNLIMDAYYGYTRIDTTIEQARLGEKLGLDLLGIPGTNGSRRIEGGWPQFNISGFTTLGVPNNFQPYYRRDPQYQYVANFTMNKGAHEVRFGGDFYSTHMNHAQPEAPGAFFGAQGGFQFDVSPRDAAHGGEDHPGTRRIQHPLVPIQHVCARPVERESQAYDVVWFALGILPVPYTRGSWSGGL